MAKETMQMDEGFSSKVVKGGAAPPDPPKLRHAIIGWSVVASLIVAIIWLLVSGAHKEPGKMLEERPGLIEKLGTKMGGVLYYDIIRSQAGKFAFDLSTPFGRRYEQTHFGPFHNTILNEGETVLKNCFENNASTNCTNLANFEFHGIGTSSQAIAETDGGCITELTTQYNPDSTRATGSQTNNGANIYRTVGTNTVDASATIEEFCLMDVNTGAGNVWTRILTGTISLGSGDGLQTTYDLTIE